MAELPEDVVQFNALEEYIDELQAGKRPDRAELARRHPELASALDCLDALNGIATSPELAEICETEDLVEPSPIGQFPRDFGSYELLEEIGRGGMGVVYKARQKGLDRTVAIKMILASHLASDEHVRRFQVEAKAAAKFHHPSIVQVHEVGRLHDQHYFTMEYIEGTSLARRIDSSSIDPETAVRWVEQVARAVGRLHRQGVVHRDLKPSNILLDADEKPYVTDFGLVKVFEADSADTATGVIVGTPSYMAPEQAAARSAAVGPASDVYSLGAILYELLTGQPPFREDTPLETVMRVLVGEPPLPRTINRRIPQELELILLKCLAKASADRYPSAEELADDLERFRKRQAITAQPPHLSQRIVRWVRREPAAASRLAVLGVFFIIENTNYFFGQVPTNFHVCMSILQVVWLLGTVGFQQLLRSERWSIPARFVWGAFDSSMLLAVLLVADGVASSLVPLLPMLIVASGLWFRERFVWSITGLSIISYGILVATYYYHWLPGRMHAESFDRPDRHVIFFVVLIGIGWGVAHLVHRLRTFMAYYGQKP